MMTTKPFEDTAKILGNIFFIGQHYKHIFGTFSWACNKKKKNLAELPVTANMPPSCLI